MANSALPQNTLTHRFVLKNPFETNIGKSLGNSRLDGGIVPPKGELLIFDPPQAEGFGGQIPPCGGKP